MKHLSLVAAMAFVVSCAGESFERTSPSGEKQLVQTEGEGAGGETASGQGLIDPAELDACIAEHMECVLSGQSMEDCAQILEGCLPKPEPRDCQADYDACVANGLPAEACENMKAICEGTAEPPVPPEDGCFQEHRACLESGQSMEDCHAVLEACLPKPEPRDCQADYDACVANGLPGEACEQMKAFCEGTAEPPAPPQ